MSITPQNRLYTKSHEWLETLPDGTIRVGVTHHAQDLMGDMVFVELPVVGRTLSAGQDCAVVESVKAASDVYAPVAGTIVAINERLSSAPEQVNKDPYGEGWLFQLRPSAPLSGLLDAKAYDALVAAEH